LNAKVDAELKGAPISEKLAKAVLDIIYTKTESNVPKAVFRAPSFSPDGYGELTFELTSDVFVYHGVKSESHFADLGSGFGKTLLQAALLRECKVT